MSAARRRNDDMPENKRREDITIKFMGLEITANGKTVTTVLFAASVLGAVAAGNYVQSKQIDVHDQAARSEHEQFIKQVKIFTYVLTASEDERKIIRRHMTVPDELKPAVAEHQAEKAAQADHGR